MPKCFVHFAVKTSALCSQYVSLKKKKKSVMFRDFFKQKIIPFRKMEHLILKRFDFGRSMAVTMLCIY